MSCGACYFLLQVRANSKTLFSSLASYWQAYSSLLIRFFLNWEKTSVKFVHGISGYLGNTFFSIVFCCSGRLLCFPGEFLFSNDDVLCFYLYSLVCMDMLLHITDRECTSNGGCPTRLLICSEFPTIRACAICKYSNKYPRLDILPDFPAGKSLIYPFLGRLTMSFEVLLRLM